MLSQAALIEFHRRSADRGRSIFEGILRNFPKRLDLWSVYLDQVRSACQGLTQMPSVGAVCVLESVLPESPKRLDLQRLCLDQVSALARSLKP